MKSYVYPIRRATLITQRVSEDPSSGLQLTVTPWNWLTLGPRDLPQVTALMGPLPVPRAELHSGSS